MIPNGTLTVIGKVREIAVYPGMIVRTGQGLTAEMDLRMDIGMTHLVMIGGIVLVGRYPIRGSNLVMARVIAKLPCLQ